MRQLSLIYNNIVTAGNGVMQPVARQQQTTRQQQLFYKNIVTVGNDVMQLVARQLQQTTMEKRMFSMWSVPRNYLEENWELVESQPAKRRLGGSCELAFSLSVVS
jgi:hypothetical protein